MAAADNADSAGLGAHRGLRIPHWMPNPPLRGIVLAFGFISDLQVGKSLAHSLFPREPEQPFPRRVHVHDDLLGKSRERNTKWSVLEDDGEFLLGPAQCCGKKVGRRRRT